MSTSIRRGPQRRDPEEFDDWLRSLTERSDPLLTWLGIVFALLVAAQFMVPSASPTGRTLTVLSWAIWVVFVVDFGIKLWLAPSKLAFLRTHWLSLLGLVLPTLRFLSFLRLLRLGRALPAARVLTSSSRAYRTSGRLFRSRLGYLAGLASIATLVAGELAYLTEGGRGGTLPTFGSALLWAAACVVGQSPTVNPATVWGQLVMLGAFAVGLVAISTLAGSVGAYLLSASHPDQAKGPTDPRPE